MVGALTVLLYPCRAAGAAHHPGAATLSLPAASHHPAVLLKAARRRLERLWRPGTPYVKTGVILTDLRPATLRQDGLFVEMEDDPAPLTDPPAAAPARPRVELLAVFDGLNQRFGRGAVRFAAAGMTATVGRWQARTENRMLRFTTRWGELLGVSSGVASASAGRLGK